MAAGAVVALVSDAGMPLVSDPDTAWCGRRSTWHPGAGRAGAFGGAGRAGGFGAAHRFLSLRRLSAAQAGTAREALEALAEEQATLIFYEAPHRILEALEAIEQALGPRPVVVARELTKIHEEFLRGTAAEIRAQLAAREAVKGEITLLIGKATAPPPDDTPVEEAVEALVAAARRAWTPSNRWRGGAGFRSARSTRQWCGRNRWLANTGPFEAVS